MRSALYRARQSSPALKTCAAAGGAATPRGEVEADASLARAGAAAAVGLGAVDVDAFGAGAAADLGAAAGWAPTPRYSCVEIGVSGDAWLVARVRKEGGCGS